MSGLLKQYPIIPSIHACLLPLRLTMENRLCLFRNFSCLRRLETESSSFTPCFDCISTTFRRSSWWSYFPSRPFLRFGQILIEPFVIIYSSPSLFLSRLSSLNFLCIPSPSLFPIPLRIVYPSQLNRFPKGRFVGLLNVLLWFLREGDFLLIWVYVISWLSACVSFST